MTRPVTLIEPGTVKLERLLPGPVERVWAYITEPDVVKRIEPMRLLVHTWTWDNADTEVTYELQPRGKEVLLTIVHRRVEGRELTASVMGGWDVHTGILADILSGAEPRPFWKTHSRLEQEFGATLRAN